MRRATAASVVLLVCLLYASPPAQAQPCIGYESGRSDSRSGSCGLFNCSYTQTKYWNIYWRDPQGVVTASRTQHATSGSGIYSQWNSSRCDPIFHPPNTIAAAGDTSVWQQRVVSQDYGSGGGCAWTEDAYFSELDTCSSDSEVGATCDPPCGEYMVCVEGYCSIDTPVLVDASGDNFRLTNAEGGVPFDINGDGVAEKLAWTEAGSDDAWLALDRNGNGAVDDGQELFGNFTPQPEPAAGREKNGFLALAEYDKPAWGGNSDGVIDDLDGVFPSLRLWQDANHNGVSEPGELHTLPALHIGAISLSYKEVRRRDRHGNWFRYKAEINGTENRIRHRLAYDVILVVGQ